MASIPTKNAVPSENFDDLRFNSAKLDEFVTSSADSYVDRLGIEHLTARGLQNSVVGALLPANNLSDLANKDTSLSNLGGGATGIAVFKAGTQSAARAAIQAAASGSNADITELTGLSTALSIDQGGTGGKTANAARTNLGIGTLGTQNASAVSITGGSIAGINDLAIADGGTGASSAATARANLGAKADAGVTDASNAGAGVVGQVLTNTTSVPSITSAAYTVMATLSLTPGDWDVTGTFNLEPASGTTVTLMQGGLNTVNNNTPGFPYNTRHSGTMSGGGQDRVVPARRFSISAATTIYLVGITFFSGGTMAGNGFIYARRVR